MNAWTVHMSFEFVDLRMLKLLALERMRKKRTVIEDLKKSLDWFLKQEKAVNTKKNFEKKRKKEKEKKK